MKKIYFISGLGADKNAFIKIRNFKGYEKVFLDWKKNKPKESMDSYIDRLTEGCEISNDDILVGLSFGGVVAMNIARKFGVNTVVLISSFKSVNNLRPLMRILIRTRSYYLLPPLKMRRLRTFFRHYFSSTSGSGNKVLASMVDASDVGLSKWSIDQIRKCQDVSKETTEIHNIIGAKDRIVNIWKNEHTHVLQNGGHFMVYENVDEINELLLNILKSKDLREGSFSENLK